MEGNGEDAPHVDPGCGQNPIGPDPVDQSLVARHPLFDAARPDHIADLRRNARGPNRLRFCRSRTADSDERGEYSTIQLRSLSVAAFYRQVMKALEMLDIPVRINTTPNE